VNLVTQITTTCDQGHQKLGIYFTGFLRIITDDEM